MGQCSSPSGCILALAFPYVACVAMEFIGHESVGVITSLVILRVILTKKGLKLSLAFYGTLRLFEDVREIQFFRKR